MAALGGIWGLKPSQQIFLRTIFNIGVNVFSAARRTYI